jgi:hypothetical protein
VNDNEEDKESTSAASSAVPIDPAISRLTPNFCLQVEALRETALLALLLQVVVGQASSNDYRRLSKIYKDSLVGAPEMPTAEFLELMRLAKRLSVATVSMHNTLSSFFVGMVSQFDSFIGNLYRELVTIKPEVIEGSQRQFTFREMQNFDSVDDARRFLIDEEIEALLRESHHQQLKQFENRFGVNLSADKYLSGQFIELTQRRNLCVHSSTRVSRHYLDICGAAGAELNSGLKVGDELKIDQEYLVHASRVLMEVAIKMAYILWVKLDPSSLPQADKMLVEIGYEILVQKDYVLARRIWDFACHDPKRHSSEEIRYMCVVNRAQAYKWSGDEETCAAILKAVDFSAAAYKFQIANAVLQDNFESTCSMMQKLGPDKEMKLAYRIWPLFAKAKLNERFGATFEEVYREPLLDSTPSDKVTVTQAVENLTEIVKKNAPLFAVEDSRAIPKMPARAAEGASATPISEGMKIAEN